MRWKLYVPVAIANCLFKKSHAHTLPQLLWSSHSLPDSLPNLLTNCCCIDVLVTDGLSGFLGAL
jgi:hypothetical protein